MEDAMARNLCSNNVPRAELDHRARDARVKLGRIEQLLSPRAAGKGFRLVRLFGGRFGRAPKLARTRGSVSVARPDAMPEIDSAWYSGRAAA
jgi:hypothetical protein